MFNMIEHDIWLCSEDSDCEQVLLPGMFSVPGVYPGFTRQVLLGDTWRTRSASGVHPGKCCSGTRGAPGVYPGVLPGKCYRGDTWRTRSVSGGSPGQGLPQGHVAYPEGIRGLARIPHPGTCGTPGVNPAEVL